MFVQRGFDRRLIDARIDCRIRQGRMIQHRRNHRDVFARDREPRGTGPSQIVNRSHHPGPLAHEWEKISAAPSPVNWRT
jgi:hypothetical protein